MTAVRSVALLAGGDRFEDFYDKLGVTFDGFVSELGDGWIFNYVGALRTAGVRTTLVFVSARTQVPRRAVHRRTGSPVWLLPSPWVHRTARSAGARFVPESAVARSLASYLATPFGMLGRALRSSGARVVLCQEYEHPRFDVATLLRRLLGVRVFATYQGAPPADVALERAVRRVAIGRADGLIVAGADEAARVAETYRVPQAKIARIPNPVDVDTWRPVDQAAARRKIGLPIGARIVGWHGHVQIWRKGLDVLLDAWDVICRDRPDLDPVLLLVGTGRNTGALRQRAASNPRIRWIDRHVTDPDELRGLVGAADVYTLPSRHEGFAVAPLEAMSTARPVVVADCPGASDLLTEGEEAGGVIVPRDDPRALAAALVELLGDPDRARRLGARGRRHVERSYSFEVVGRRLADLLLSEETSGRWATR